MVVGRYASVVPWAFDTPPIANANPQALVFFLSDNECEDVPLPDFDPIEPVDSQRDIAERIEHVLFLIEDGRLPPCIIVGLTDPAEPIAAAVERAGVAGADHAAPVLAVGLYGLADGPRGRIAARLPFIPHADAPMPDMPADFVSKTIVGVSNRWP